MPSITDYPSNEYQFHVVEVPFEDGRHPEDGEIMLGVAFSVVAVANDGTQFARSVGMSGWDVQDFEGEPFVLRSYPFPEDLQDVAETLSNRLNMLHSPSLNPDAWTYTGAVYGSEAYVSRGIERNLIAAECEYF